MALYIDKREIPHSEVMTDRGMQVHIEDVPDAVLQYVIDEHRAQVRRLDYLHDAYLGKNVPHMSEDSDIAVVLDYPRYIVDTVVGMFLGDPVKYNTADGANLSGGVKTTVRDGDLIRADKVKLPKIDITPIKDAYGRQNISDVDTEIGRDLGEYGEAYELEYADETPMPKTTVCSPRVSTMVRDTSTEHKKLFFVTYEQRKRVDKSLYYAVFVYTDAECIEYHSDGITSPLGFSEISRMPHFFGEVPAVEYRNNADRLGDYETALSVIEAANKLMSDRVTDKRRFIDSVLFLYGMTLDDDQKRDLKTYGLVDSLPSKQDGAAAEYVQKALEENSVHVLYEDLVREIHKQSMTVDMTDVSFGTSSGQAMKLKLLTMTMLVKNKIRSMERGLRKRFQMYNRWMNINGKMPIIPKEAVDIVFTIQMPVDEQGIVNIVQSMQNIVDDETLLSLLWFVKDPQETIKRVKLQKAEARAEYFDTFGFRQKENSINAEDGTESGAGGKSGM